MEKAKILGRLEAVSQNCGLKILGNWYNADNKYREEQQLNKADIDNKLKNHMVEITLNDKGYYDSIIDKGVVERITGEDKKYASLLVAIYDKVVTNPEYAINNKEETVEKIRSQYYLLREVFNKL